MTGRQDADRGPGPGCDAREAPADALQSWREPVRRHLGPRPGMSVLDLGAGAGTFARAFADWFGVEVLAVEPSEPARTQMPPHPHVRVLRGRADDLPVPESGVDGAWLSRVTHHLGDLDVAAAELRRALRPGAPVLVREVFAGRCDGSTLVRFFPEAQRRIDTYPSVEQTCAAFARAGFEQVALEAVPQWIAPNLATFIRGLRRDADGLLRSLSDEEFARGMDRLRAAGEAEGEGDGTYVPVLDHVDLLVLR